MAKVSVITVCLNAADALSKTLENISKQNYADMEVIVVDGWSSDNTRDVMKAYTGIITKSISEPDKGIYDAMNKGVALADGDYCIFINAGDEIAAPNTFIRVFQSAEAQDADVIYGDVIKTDKEHRRYVKQAEPPHNAHRMFFCHQSALVRTECLRQFPFDIRYTMSADFKFFKLMWKSGKKFCQLHFPIAVFDTNGISNTSRGKGIRQNIAVIKEIDSFWQRLRLLPRLYFVLFMIWLRSR